LNSHKNIQNLEPYLEKVFFFSRVLFLAILFNVHQKANAITPIESGSKNINVLTGFL